MKTFSNNIFVDFIPDALFKSIQALRYCSNEISLVSDVGEERLKKRPLMAKIAVIIVKIYNR